MGRKGTKHQQLKRLYEEGEPALQAKELKARERKRNADERRNDNEDSLRNRELVCDAGSIITTNVTVSNLKKQCQLWNFLSNHTKVNSIELLKGDHKRAKAGLIEILQQIIRANTELNMDVLRFGGDSNNESCKSSRDDDDLELV